MSSARHKQNLRGFQIGNWCKVYILSAAGASTHSLHILRCFWCKAPLRVAARSRSVARSLSGNTRRPGLTQPPRQIMNPNWACLVDAKRRLCKEDLHMSIPSKILTISWRSWCSARACMPSCQNLLPRNTKVGWLSNRLKAEFFKTAWQLCPRRAS